MINQSEKFKKMKAILLNSNTLGVRIILSKPIMNNYPAYFKVHSIYYFHHITTTSHSNHHGLGAFILDKFMPISIRK
jgi:hypothetical protein